MNLFRRIGLISVLAVGLLIGVSMAFGVPAHAQVDAGLKQVGDTVGLAATDPRTIAVRIINVALGFLAMILLVLVLYAGFLWMTAGGNPDQVEKAKKYLQNAVIGLIIVLSAWAITTYVITRLLTATGGGGGTSGTGGGGGGGGLGGGGSGTGFQLQSITPTGDVAIRNIVVRFIFNRDVDAASANAQISVVRVSDGQVVAGSLQAVGSLVSFTPSSPCPAPNADRFCFDGNTDFEARVGGSLRSADGRVISCGGFAPSCRSRFHTGTLVDAQPPTVSIQSPADGQSWNASSVLPIVSRVTDDSGVSNLETSADGALIGRDSPSGASTTTFDGTVVWDPSGASMGAHPLQSKAYDIDSNTAQSSQVRVVLRPAHCFNGRQDADETGNDCGGAQCGVCSGGSCTAGTDCRSGVCTGGVCVEQPVITGVSPGNGRTGTFITISGYNFGTAGSVRFWNGTGFTVVATAPAACTGIVTWSPTQVLVEAPGGAITGPIQLTNSVSSLVDATNDRNGPAVPDYVFNALARPGLCAATPDSGLADVDIALRGAGLGASRGGSDKVTFQDTEPSAYGAWGDREVHVQAPRITPSTYAVKLQSSGIDSNTVAFNLLEPVRTNPVLDNVDPATGPIGTYVTLNGHGFGDRPDLVKFKNLDTGDSGAADVSFPAQCAASWWTDSHITVKVPGTLGVGAFTRPTSPGRYEITAEKGGLPSNAVAFQVIAGSAGPGICAIEPIAGPSGVTTTAYGERFGVSSDGVTFQGASTRVNATDIPRWSNASVEVRVPNTSRTGAVKIKLGAVESNGVNFQVRNCNEAPDQICGATRQCCADGTCTAVGGRCAAGPQASMYAWQTSTGEIPINPRVVEQCDTVSATPLPPSPSPWSRRTGGDTVCVNAAVSLRFTTRLDPATISAANVIVQKCTGTGADPCSSGTPTNVLGTLSLRSVGTPSEYVYFRPTGGRFDPGSTFKVTLRKQIRSNPAHIQMLEDPGCGSGNSYCYTFKTGPASSLCSASRVSVTPNPYRATEVGETVTYNAVPLTDSCLVLDDQINWRWYTGRGLLPAETDTRASITNNLDATGNVRGEQIGTALEETGTAHVPVNAATAQAGMANVTGTAQLFINFVPPFITEFFPNCQKACTNAEIWAKFNVNLDRARVDASRIMLWKCANENCDTYSPTTPLTMCPGGVSVTQSTPPGRMVPIWNFVHVAPMDPGTGCTTSLLQPGAYYRVVFRGGTNGFFSQSGLAMDATHLNHPSGFTWTFRVKTENDGRCTASRVEVEPTEKYETLIGARQLFQGTPVSGPDECSANGQRLIVDQSMDWNVADANVAKLVNGRGGSLVDTTSNLPANCNASCLKTGSNGVVGRIANCGNSIVETTDPNDCRRGAVACAVGQAGCRNRAGDACVLLPAGSKGGEECDLGASNGVPAGLCSATCFWTGATGPACGNGALDRGEQCDARQLICAGGANEGALCTVDAECTGGRCNGTRNRPGCTSQCLLTGTGSGSGVTSVCGEGTVGYGEACDDGNALDGDGCSSTCLHEGSTAVTAICGNGVVEPGETCDVGSSDWPGRCDHATCLRSGTDSCPAGVGGPLNCCGNGVVEPGEDCEGNTNGCSSRCLLKGSSVGYAVPSFCGDGLPLGTGEQCEAVRPGDGLTDAKQLAETVGRGTADPVTRLMSTDIRATYTAVNGTSKYGVRCGNTQEIEDCNAAGTPPVNGLTDSGCCMRRPTMAGPQNPQPDELGVCRNPMIYGTFDGMIRPETLNNNFIVAEENAGASCPDGQQQVTLNGASVLPPNGWLARLWWNISRWLFGDSATAAVWCAGPVTGNITTQELTVGAATHTRAIFSTQNALKARTRYRVIFRGDTNLADNNRTGLRNTDGVVMNGDVAWNFTTGDRICQANQINVEDVNPVHPYIFKAAGEDHRFQGSVFSQQSGRLVPIVPVTEYAWTWDPWAAQNPPAVLSVVGGATAVDPSQRSSTTTIRALNRNGSTLVFGGIHITRDDANTPTTLGNRLYGSRVASVMLCVSPWPYASPQYPNVPLFADQQGNGVLNTINGTGGRPNFAAGPFYNFATFYCMDGADSATSTDDIPPMVVNGAQLTASDAAKGVLRQYFLTYEPGVSSALLHDAIGIRVLENPHHLSPMEWYNEQNFGGSPEKISVDGYEAVKSGTSLYVGALNTQPNPSAGSVYSNIYLFSYNDDAQKLTVNIFNQLVSNWLFNSNINQSADGYCHEAGGDFTVVNGALVLCSADWECAQDVGTLRTCASIKTKLQRDLVRVSDFQSMTRDLERSHVANGTFPTLTNGSFVQGITNSRWPSWQTALGAAISKELPQDPINRLLTCGRCRGGDNILGKPCVDSSDCSEGKQCVSEVDANSSERSGFDPATCWNAERQRFLCPQLDRPVGSSPQMPSRAYQYRSVDAGARYELSTELEAVDYTRYSPPLLTEIKQCASSRIRLCNVDADCGTTLDSRGVPQPVRCVGTGGRWVYRDMCSAGEYGNDNICGNRILGAGELCETGDTRTTDCRAPSGLAGTKVQSCASCTDFVDTATTLCAEDQRCGNGIVEKYRCYPSGGTTPGLKYGQRCTTLGSTSECQDPRDPAGSVMSCQSISLAGRGSEELCDDGAQNGTYGHCNRTCSGYDATCGDGQLSLGETCDNGFPARPGLTENGAYCDSRAGCVPAASCGYDCRSRAPFCGDGQVTAPSEQCDTGTETGTSAVCYNLLGDTTIYDGQACTTNADCGPAGSGNACGNSPGAPREFGSCVGITAKRCAGSGKRCVDGSGTTNPALNACNTSADCPGGYSCMDRNVATCRVNADCGADGQCLDYPTQRTRTCGALGTANQCHWNQWSSCVPARFCGDGIVDTGEQCDDGNTSNNDSCTAQCRRNVCGDGLLYQGAEQCDRGVNNGQACSAEYGVTCSRCSLSCRMEAQSGGYCGDGVRNGGEQCDRTDVPPAVTCQSIGFDYLKTAQCTHIPYCTFRTGSERVSVYNMDACVSRPGETAEQSQARCINEFSNQCEGASGEYFAPSFDVPGPVPTSLQNRVCTNPGAVAASLSCGPTCQLAGCGRCSDEPGPGEQGSVELQVFDAVYSFHPVPNARVTLYYQGVRVSDAVTNENGTTTITGLNTRNECGGYRIVVDSYVDNPCTRLNGGAARPNCNGSPANIGEGVNEAANGGYWPYESRVFSYSTYLTNGIRNNRGRVYLIPRVGPGETLAVTTWNGTIPRYIDAHVALPAGTTNTTAGGDHVRDVRWNGQGNPDVSGADPHAYLYCFHSSDPTDFTCGTFNEAPETIKFKRGTWARTGKYHFILNDYYQNGNITDTVSYFNEAGRDLSVRVVTQESYYEVTPPTSASCNGTGKSWYVFTQDAATGNITFSAAGPLLEGQGGQFACLNTVLPGEPAATITNTFGGL